MTEPNATAANCVVHGHDYQARYDEVTNVEATSSANFWTLARNRPAQIVDKVWIADVCAKCGHVIPRARK